MTVLVTGGDGYIGSHVNRTLRDAGYETAIVDALSGIDVLDTERLARFMREHHVDSIIHLAGFKNAGLSVELPEHTIWQNTGGLLSVLAAAARNDVRALVYSSSAAVYGSPERDATEDTPTHPESPYGLSKLLGEHVLAASHLSSTSLRYFNVAGSGWPDLYDASPNNLFPRLCSDISSGRRPHIHGSDFPTRDGTAIRDYVHVSDIADAHVSALQALHSTKTQTCRTYNLGSGTGHSVRQVLDAFCTVTSSALEPTIGPRRPGDPTRIVADVSRAKAQLGWTPKRDLTDMVTSAWEAHQWQSALA